MYTCYVYILVVNNGYCKNIFSDNQKMKKKDNFCKKVHESKFYETFPVTLFMSFSMIPLIPPLMASDPATEFWPFCIGFFSHLQQDVKILELVFYGHFTWISIEINSQCSWKWMKNVPPDISRSSNVSPKILLT